MKKIFSLLLVVCMLFATMIAVSAAGTCNISFSAAKTAVKVDETFDVTLNVELAGGANFSGGNIYVSYDNRFATIEAINTGTLTASATTPANPTTGFANWTLPSRPTTSGSYMVVTFRAIAPTDAFVVGATSTTFRSSAGAITAASIGTATVKIEAEKEWVAQEAGVKSSAATTWENYENVVVLPVDIAVEVGAEKYGIDISNGTGTKEYVFEGIAGEGTLEYVVAFWGVPEGVTITATPKAYK